MSFMDLVKDRYSVRSYADRPVEEEKLEAILEAGRLCPTACNFQPQRIYVLKSKEALEKVRNVTRMAFNAPVVLLICYDKNVSWKALRYGDDTDAGDQDASIVATTMMMEATELGLGTLWARAFDAKKMAEAFELPEHMQVVCLLDIGYAAEGAEPSQMHTSVVPKEQTIIEL